MKHSLLFTLLLGMILICQNANGAERKLIRISTNQTDLILQVGENGRLYQSYFGEKLLHDSDLEAFSWDIHAASDGSVSQRGWEVYSGSGNEDFFEPAVAITHNDGNPSTWLYSWKSPCTMWPMPRRTSSRLGVRYATRKRNQSGYRHTPPPCSTSVETVTT